jgi:hypothetical protein
MTRGYLSGKWGDSKNDSFLSENRHISLLSLPMPENPPASRTLQLVSFPQGNLIGSWTGDYGVDALDFASDGTLLSVYENRVQRLEFNRQDGSFRYSPLGNVRVDTSSSISLDVSADRIAVGVRAENFIYVLNREGKELHRIGTGEGWEPGPWNPNIIGRPTAVTLTPAGDLWVAEETLTPKRVARYNRDGKFVEEFLGPPMYGGGGYLDPNLKRFYYRGMEFALDWEAGTSHLLNLNDHAYHANTPDEGTSTFAFTSIGRPVFHNGKRYLHDGLRIVRKPDDSAVWLPAFVAGYAQDNPFLFRKEIWNKHWGKMDLTGKFFVWCDRNGDGTYQVDEVELGDADSLPRMGGGSLGPGLSLWGTTYRWAPHRITAEGVPLFRIGDIQPFDYEKLAPHYRANYTVSGPRSAKPGYSGIRYVSSTGNLAQEGQPFVVKADGSILGGASPTQPSDYQPPIVGQVVSNAWSWTGGR